MEKNPAQTVKKGREMEEDVGGGGLEGAGERGLLSKGTLDKRKRTTTIKVFL